MYDDAMKSPVLRSDDKRVKPRRCATCGHGESIHKPSLREPDSVGCRKCYCTAFKPRVEK